MSTNVYARAYQIGDDEKIVDLLKSSFPDWKKKSNSLDYWRWKYLDTPLGSQIAVVVNGDKVIGVWHEIRFNTVFGPETVSSRLGDDTATHPEFRGAGVYDKLDGLFKKWHAEAKLKFLYVITTNPIIVKWELKRGIPEFPHVISHLIRMKDVNSHLKAKSIENAWVVGFGFTMLTVLNIIVNWFTPPIRRESDFSISTISKFDAGIDKFWDKVRGSYSYILERKRDYLNWRYCDSRGGTFHVLQAKEGEDILGFVATEVRENDGYSEGYILDLLALPKRRDVVDALFKEACKYLDELEINVVHYKAVKGHPYEALSSRSNFTGTLQTNDMHIFVTFTEADEKRDALRSSSPSVVHFNYSDYL